MLNNLIIYVIYDVKAKTIARVFLFKNMEVCLRFLKQNLTQLGVNLIDYELCEVGEIDEEILKISLNYEKDQLPIMETFYNQPCAKEFRAIKMDFLEKLKKEQEKEEKEHENQIPNFGNPFAQKIK